MIYDADAIILTLAPMRAEIPSAKNDGQTTGLVMNHLKDLDRTGLPP